MTYSYNYPRPSVTVDVVVFGLDMQGAPELSVLLIKRGSRSGAFDGCWALPGGFVGEHEDLDDAAFRELREETHAEPTYVEQLATFGTPGRDPRGHVISVAYMALTRTDAVTIEGDDDAEEAAWFPITEVEQMTLAFDHGDIVRTATRRLRSKLQWQPIGIDLLPEAFAIDDLQRVYETVLGRQLNRRNFYRKVMSYGVLESAESIRTGGRGRPPRLWRFDRSAYELLVEEGQDFEL